MLQGASLCCRRNQCIQTYQYQLSFPNCTSRHNRSLYRTCCPLLVYSGPLRLLRIRRLEPKFDMHLMGRWICPQMRSKVTSYILKGTELECKLLQNLSTVWNNLFGKRCTLTFERHGRQQSCFVDYCLYQRLCIPISRLTEEVELEKGRGSARGHGGNAGSRHVSAEPLHRDNTLVMTSSHCRYKTLQSSLAASAPWS